MRCYVVRVTAEEAYRGNSDDPLLWHFKVEAGTKADAVAIMRRSGSIPAGAMVKVVAELRG